MIEPTEEQITASRRLNVSLHFGSAPLAIARLVELVEELQRRVDELEGRPRKWMRSK